MRVILIFRSNSDREVSESEKVRELQTRLHQHLLFCACSCSLSLVGPLCLSLSPSQEEEALDGDPGLMFIFADDVTVGACLGAAGCPVAVAAAVPPPTHTACLKQWVTAIVLAEVTCAAREVTPDIVLVRGDLHSQGSHARYPTDKGISCTF